MELSSCEKYFSGVASKVFFLPVVRTFKILAHPVDGSGPLKEGYTDNGARDYDLFLPNNEPTPYPGGEFTVSGAPTCRFVTENWLSISAARRLSWKFW